ncbi:unnamed protein product [Protopolystoma xenopodis]|uniref:SUI1 domain-containing protein n=1 Tax=Protopolystoma xenopodis TaxID=117903 RepID=A0A448X1A7_9PLAT|nr:unnamed protein product [Protopolystoma xenopodis]
MHTIDPFAGFGEEKSDDTLVHIRIQQRNGRKTLTTVQGIDPEYDLKKILRYSKKKFACNGTVVNHDEYGEILQLQGDQRKNIAEMLVECQIVTEKQVKIHGF